MNAPLEAESGRVIIVMGVAGAGKTTVGRQLAGELRWRFCDGDTLHPRENIDKILRGLPLTDEDRHSWLERLRSAIAEWIAVGDRVVLAGSLLKAAYRATVLNGHCDLVRVVYLQASRNLLQQRLINRTGHFMKEGLLASQLEILEEPLDALILDASQAPGALTRQIRSAFGL